MNVYSHLLTRSIVLAVVVSVLAPLVLADIPQVISYQGKVTDTGGTPIADGDYSMTFTIYDAETSGSSLWSSGTVTVTVAGGIFSVLLGESPQPTLDLDFDSDYWLEIDIAGDVQSPRTPLGSVGYAYMASGIVPGTEVSGSVTSGTNAAFKAINTATVGTAYGIHGWSASTSGRGIEGYATATSGTTYGGRFVSYSSSGRGVYGLASATSGATYGVWGQNESPEGRGVYGRASATEGNAFGVMGRSDSSTGRGVYGWASATEGFACGVYGISDSPSGYAGYFDGRAQVKGDLTVISGGKVGIGVTSPENPLVISGTESDTAGTGAQLMLRDTANSSHAFALRIGSTGVADLHLDSYSGGWQTLMTVDRENGAVGIGAASPRAKLDVQNDGMPSGGSGIYGESTSTTGFAVGVFGIINSSEGVGVAGFAGATSGDTHGVHGQSHSATGIGVEGWASATAGATIGVYGQTSSPDGQAVKGLALADSGTNYGVYGRTYSEFGYGIYYSGGLAGTGTKSCVVKTSQGPALMYCQESPENWFEDFGEGQLMNGRCHIDLDPLFLETVTIDEVNPMKVFVELGDDCNGVFVRRGVTGFEVVELRNGNASVPFCYRVVAKRKGFEDKRLDYCKAAETDSYLYPELREKELRRFEEERARMEEERHRHEEARASRALPMIVGSDL